MANQEKFDFSSFETTEQNHPSSVQEEFLEMLRIKPLTAIASALIYNRIERGKKEVKNFLEMWSNPLEEINKDETELNDPREIVSFKLFPPTLNTKSNQFESITDEEFLTFFKFIGIIKQNTTNLSELQNGQKLSFDDPSLNFIFFYVSKNEGLETNTITPGGKCLFSGWDVELYIRRLNLPKIKTKKPENLNLELET